MRLVSQQIAVEIGDTTPMGRGEPATPSAFTWNKTRYQIKSIEATGKKVGNDHTHGSAEQYVQRHEYRAETTEGLIVKLYFDRYKKVWVLHSIE